VSAGNISTNGSFPALAGLYRNSGGFCSSILAFMLESLSDFMTLLLDRVFKLLDLSLVESCIVDIDADLMISGDAGVFIEEALEIVLSCAGQFFLLVTGEEMFVGVDFVMAAFCFGLDELAPTVL
jgi:hypothetical protein